jgi:hypothetical protein
MEKLTIKKACINKCGHKVILPRNPRGVTRSIECSTCKTLGVKKSRAEFLNLTKKGRNSTFE